MIGLLLFLLFFSIFNCDVQGQLSDKESLRNVTVCDLANVVIACDDNTVIAIQSLDFRYRDGCDTINCCSFNGTDDIPNEYDYSRDMPLVRRTCSGQNNCTVNFGDVTAVFGTKGYNAASYVFIEYFCIHDSRMADICSYSSLETTDAALYITNTNYPRVSTESGVCACSLEVLSCTSEVLVYVVDIDLYLNDTICNQSVVISDREDSTLEVLNCGNYYSNGITIVTIPSHYITINFNDNTPTRDIEGQFFLGLAATEANTTFTLNCSSTAETLCTDCDEVINITNGYISLDEPNITKYNSSATVTCEPGYDVTYDTIFCLETGVWENSSCVIKDCGNVPNISNGDITEDNTTSYGSVASVICHTGYETLNSTIECLDTGFWSNSSCTIKDCGQVVNITNGNITLDISNTTTYASTASVNCSPGYNTTTETIYCLDSGMWKNTTCVIKDCGNVPNISNGDITLMEGNVTTYGSIASVICHTGYETLNSNIECLDTGFWSNSTCSIKDCGDVYNITNGNTTLDIANMTTYNSTASVICLPGYNTTNEIIFCLDSGQWENATCTIQDCGNVPNISNGDVYVFIENVTTYGSNASVICHTGYETLNSVIECLDTGLWSESSCTIKDCGEVLNITNGNITLNIAYMTTYNSSANVTCFPGYEASVNTIQCLEDGTWDNATCNIKDCGEVGFIINGNITLDISNMTTYTSTATVYCLLGYETENETISCLDSGMWENTTCVVKDCGPPANITNGEITLGFDNLTTVNATANVTCAFGYVATNETIVCLYTGFWENATCERIDCGPIDDIDLGHVTLNDENITTYIDNATATVTCSYGYEALDATVKCLQTGDWETTTCNLIDCGMVNNIDFGYITLNEDNITTYLDNATATVTCNVGYQATNENISCQADGTWENTSCEIIDCGSRFNITNGEITLDSTNSTTYNSTAIVSCSYGYTALNDTIKCLLTGEWANTACDLIDCRQVDDIDFGYITLNEDNITAYLDNATATVWCNVGYQTTNENISCQDDGTWENSSCEIIDCGQVDDINFGYITLNEDNITTYLDNATATVWCNVGYQATNENISCQDDGTWENTSCEIIDCGSMFNITNGEIILDSANSTTYNSTATVSCLYGYTTLNDTITCLLTGDWENTTCDLIDCGQVNDIDFGYITLNEDNITTYLDNATATVTCNVGYRASTENISCQDDGNWDTASCEIIDCGMIYEIDFGSIELNEDNLTTYLDNATATVTCNIGYQATNENISCQVDGTWENTSCEIIDCGSMFNISNGVITLDSTNSTTYDSTAIVSCSYGYEALNDTIKCLLTGDWEIADCNIIDCGPVNDIDFAYITLDEDNITTYLDNATATVTCNYGYETTNENISCQDDGTWENTSCEIIDCGHVPDIYFATVILNVENNSTYSSTANVTCTNGYETQRSLIQCLETGLWENSSCTIKDCGVPPDISNGNINLDVENITTYNATATVMCNTGYETINDQIYCLDTGMWEDTTCQLIDCGEVPSINFGNVTLNDEGNSTYSSLATVTCFDGYVPLNSSIQCEDSGMWSVTSCVGKDCGSVANITFGDVTLDDPNNSTYGSTATVTCDIGYMTDNKRIYCQQSGEWENASCFVIDCGTPGSLSNGNITLTNVSDTLYEATAVVTCDLGYTASRNMITCLNTGKWQTSSCFIPTTDNSCEACIPIIVVMALFVAITLLVFGAYTIYKRIKHRRKPIAAKNAENGNLKNLEDEIKENENKKKRKKKRLNKNN